MPMSLKLDKTILITINLAVMCTTRQQPHVIAGVCDTSMAATAAMMAHVDNGNGHNNGWHWWRKWPLQWLTSMKVTATMMADLINGDDCENGQCRRWRRPQQWRRLQQLPTLMMLIAMMMANVDNGDSRNNGWLWWKKSHCNGWCWRQWRPWRWLASTTETAALMADNTKSRYDSRRWWQIGHDNGQHWQQIGCNNGWCRRQKQPQWCDGWLQWRKRIPNSLLYFCCQSRKFREFSLIILSDVHTTRCQLGHGGPPWCPTPGAEA